MVQLTFFADYTQVIKIDMGFRHDLVKTFRLYSIGNRMWWNIFFSKFKSVETKSDHIITNPSI